MESYITMLWLQVLSKFQLHSKWGTLVHNAFSFTQWQSLKQDETESFYQTYIYYFVQVMEAEMYIPITSQSYLMRLI